MTPWSDLNKRIEDCGRCPRLIDHCQNVATKKRKAYADEDYWGKPVPNFGRANVPLLIVGLAPGAHGANRTGRMFTGDRSGEWLYRAMHRSGFCNQAESINSDDGLRLRQCAITAVCHCAPPDNKPKTKEVENCSSYFQETIAICRPRVFLALGAIAWQAMVRYSIAENWLAVPRPKFGHGHRVDLKFGRKKSFLVGCYHPSQQNTFTKRLTEQMLDKVFADVRVLIDNKK